MNSFRRRLFIGSLEDRIAPATFTVMNLNDSGADSLRDCVSKANAAAGADTVAFQSGLTGTITLTTGEIAISQAVSIQGPGSTSLSVSGNNASRIFNTSSAAAGTAVTMRDLTLTGGNASGFGGAVLGIDEALTLTNCVFSGSTASTSGGAVSIAGSVGGTLTATDCSFTGNTALTGVGGAIAVFAGTGGKLNVQRCTVSGNTSLEAGGLFGTTYLLVDSSTISGNTATATSFGYGGGGIRTEGIFASGALTVRNCTISGNSTGFIGGGILIANAGTGTLVLQNCTITANSACSPGGGVARTGSGNISVESTIISGNSNATVPDLSSTGTVSVKTSAIGSGSGFTKTDLGGNLAFGTNLKLGPLANNGGTTFTHLPANDSPLLNVGSNPATLTNDQRGTGYPRAFGSGVDIGAVENRALVVTNTNDAGSGSLRQAVQDANTNAGADTVTFDAAVFATLQTIKLTTGEIFITTDPITITGPAARVNIDGNASSRIFQVFNTIGAVPIVLQNLNLANGKTTSTIGGCGILLFTTASLTIQNCNLTNLTATANGAAIATRLPSAITIEDSTLSGNSAGGIGGAVRGSPSTTIVVRRTTLSGNLADGSGGAIAFSGYLTCEDSTISGNTASSGSLSRGGGGIYNYGYYSHLTVKNTTISGNTTAGQGGGVWSRHSIIMDFQNSTITGNSSSSNGGGIAQIGGNCTVSLNSTIVAANNNSAYPVDIAFGAPVIISGSNNLIGVADIGQFTLSGSSNLTGTKAAPLDAKLGPLANNGGPTKTHALLDGSPAIDAGSNLSMLVNDQRGAGFPRVRGAAADIGAFEAQPLTLIVSNANDSGAGSLRQAVLDANANPATDIITFDSTFFSVPRTIALSSTTSNSDAVTIIGPGPALCTVSGNNTNRILDTQLAHGNRSVSISGLTFTAGKTTGTNDGAAIFAADQRLTLSNCVFTSNSSGRHGGAISIVLGVLAASDCVFTNNMAAINGGALDLETASTTLTRSALSGNTAGASGGGIHSYNTSSLIVDACTFSSNKASIIAGGAINHIRQGGTNTIVVRNSTLASNSAGGNGGGIAVNFGVSLSIQNCTITGNSGGGNGGAIFGDCKIDSSILFSDAATNSGPEISANTLNINTSLIASVSGASGISIDGFTLSHIGNDPQLGPLASNGGPTQTRALLGGSPAINNGSNPSSLLTDQRGTGFARSVDQTDIGAFELQTQPAKITSVQINDGTAQRSRVTSLLITFDQPPLLPNNPADGFQLKRQSDNAIVTLAGATVGNTVTLTFTGGPVDFQSLADGRYTLTAIALKIANLDGDGNGTVGDDFVLIGNPATNKVFRLFGDADGNGIVDGIDFGAFRTAFNTNNTSFSSDGAGPVDGLDFGQFRMRFGVTI